MGSNYFFKQYPDFRSKDTDYVELTDDPKIKGLMVIRGKGDDVFIFRRKPKDLMIKEALKSNLAMVLGKFLIPEFCEELGFTIEDLQQLEPLTERLDEAHSYEKAIYLAYIVNREFRLTDAQRLKAYEIYKNSRRK